MLLTVVTGIALAMLTYGLRDVRFSWSTPGDDGSLDSTEVDLRRQKQRSPFVDVDVLPEPPNVVAISGRRKDGGPYYLHARIRLDLQPPTVPGPFADQALFYLDTSTGEHPDRFHLRVKLLRKILESDENIKWFKILVPGSPTRSGRTSRYFPNTPKERADLAKLDSLPESLPPPPTVSLADAFEEIVRHRTDETPRIRPLHVFLLLGDALDATGADASVMKFNAEMGYALWVSCFCTSPAACKGPLLKALARVDGGAYECRTEEDLPAAAAAYRKAGIHLDRLRFVGGPAAREIRIDSSGIQGSQRSSLRIGAQFTEPGHTTLVIEGRFGGDKFVKEYPLEVHAGDATAARAYDELPASPGP
jgi:hypothetical protein